MEIINNQYNDSLLSTLIQWLRIVKPFENITNINKKDEGSFWIDPNNAHYVVYGFTNMDDSDFGCKVYLPELGKCIHFKSSYDIVNFINTGKTIVQG